MDVRIHDLESVKKMRYLYSIEGSAAIFVAKNASMFSKPTLRSIFKKPMTWSSAQPVRFELGHYEVHFCRCPKCVEVFRENPEFYVKRLQGDIPNNIQSINQNDQNTKT